MPRWLKAALLFAGGVLHGLFILLGSVGLWSLIITLLRPAYDSTGGSITTNLAQTALLPAAIILGWFCMKQTGVIRPWLTEIAAFLLTLPIAAIVLFVGGALTYEYRTDTEVARLILLATYVVGALLGGALFHVAGRQSSRHPQRSAPPAFDSEAIARRFVP